MPLGLGLVLCSGVLEGRGEAETEAMISLSALSRQYGFQSLAVRGDRAVLLTRFQSLELEKDSRRALFDGLAVWLNGPVAKSWGRLMIRQTDADKTVAPLINPGRALRTAGCGVVVLDAGHGGEDRGASMSRWKVEEKQLTLELAEQVRAILAHYGVPVRLTRADDRQVALDERCRRAGEWKADVFVSLHFNAAASSQPSGIETYLLTPAGCSSTADQSAAGRNRGACPGNRNDGANLVLGYLLHKSLLKHTRAEDRGIRRARFVVIRDASCPAALIECGFLSNPGDQQKIYSGPYRKALARGVAEGIMAYLNAVKRARHLNP